METLPGSNIALLLKGPLDGMRLVPSQYKDEKGRALDVIKLPLQTTVSASPSAMRIPPEPELISNVYATYYLRPFSIAVNRYASREFCVYVHSSVLASWTMLDTVYNLFHRYPRPESAA